MTDITLVDKQTEVAIQRERSNRNDGFQELKSQLLGFIINRIPDREDAEDILQDVYLQMSTVSEPIEQLRSWLYRVTRNKITDRFRKKKPTSFSQLDQTQEEAINISLQSEESYPDDEMMDNLIWETTKNALDELPPNQKEVFEMHEFEGMSFQAISQILDVPVNTLISRKHYAVKHLRNKLENIYNVFKD